MAWPVVEGDFDLPCGVVQRTHLRYDLIDSSRLAFEGVHGLDLCGF